MPDYLSRLKSVKQYNERGQLALVRVDYNIETIDGQIIDDTRIRASLPTLEHLVAKDSKIILLSHRGRPKGTPEAELSLQPVAEHLARCLNRKLLVIEGDSPKFADYAIPHIYFLKSDLRRLKREALAESLKPGDIVLAENIRFYPEEEKIDENFAQKIAALADVYINEAFSVDHHPSSTITLLPKLLPSFAGLRLLDEIKNLNFASNASRKPLVLVIGGAKITEKEKMLQALLPRADQLLVGGAMANLFLHTLNYEVGDSLLEREGVSTAQNILRNFRDKIVLPVDTIVGLDENGGGKVKSIEQIGLNEKILDIGPQTILKYAEIIKQANTIIWNGPLGFFENKVFAHGTLALGRLIAARGGGKAFVLIGGGETVEALHQTGMSEYVDFVSTGGGAMLSFLGGQDMPGLRALVK